MQIAQMVGIVLILVLMLLGLAAVQGDDEMSDAEIRTLVNAMLDHPNFQEAVNWGDEEIQALVNAQASHPSFLDATAWSDEEIQALVEAQFAHPAFQATEQEDCAQVILMAAVLAGDYDALPPDSEAERLCDWYSEQVQ